MSKTLEGSLRFILDGWKTIRVDGKPNIVRREFDGYRIDIKTLNEDTDNLYYYELHWPVGKSRDYFGNFSCVLDAKKSAWTILRQEGVL